MADPSSPYPEVPAVDALAARIRAEVASLSLDGHDRDCALAMLSQADSRFSSRLDAIQVVHLLAIGRRAGVAVGRAQAAADIRAEQERWERLGYDDSGAWVAAYRIALAKGSYRDAESLDPEPS